MSFSKKSIRVTISLNGEENYFQFKDDSKLDIAKFDGLACKVALNYGNGALSPHGRVSIANLSMEKIDKLIRIKWNTKEALLNTIKIEVREGHKDYQVVFHGGITFAMVDMESAPDVWLHIETTMGQRQILEIDPPFSRDAGEKVQDIIAELLKGTDYTLENNGVDMIANDVYLDGTRMNKIISLCEEYRIDHYPQGNIFSICPKGVPREMKVPEITPTNGLIGYPKPDMHGVHFTCLYRNDIFFGGLVEIKNSVIEMANKQYIVYGLRMNLEANIPNGQWVIDVYGGGEGILIR